MWLRPEVKLKDNKRIPCITIYSNTSKSPRGSGVYLSDFIQTDFKIQNSFYIINHETRCCWHDCGGCGLGEGHSIVQSNGPIMGVTVFDGSHINRDEKKNFDCAKFIYPNLHRP